MGSSDAARQPDDVYGLVGTYLDNKFHVQRVVAEGGFGLVYYAMQATLEKPIALKLLKLPGDLSESAKQEFAQKFAAEARMVARLNHPNIVQAVDFGISQMPNGMSVPWMALEWAPGRTLNELIYQRRGQGFSPPEVLRILRPVLQALAYAHDDGIAHRDIKPSNIMVTETRRDWLARLMDFGIAKVMTEGETVDSGETRTASPDRAFSLRYAAPEQLSGMKSGPWTDVHAMALITLELLTGTSAYAAKDMTALYGEILNPQRPTPRTRSLDAGPWELVLARGLAMNPAERFHHAADFLAALEAEVPPALRPLGAAPGTQTAPDGSGSWQANPDHTWMPAGAQRPAAPPGGAMYPMPGSVSGTGPGGMPMHHTGRGGMPMHHTGPGGMPFQHTGPGGIPTATIPPALTGARPPPSSGSRMGLIVGVSGAFAAATVTAALFLAFGVHRPAPPAAVPHAAASVAAPAPAATNPTPAVAPTPSVAPVAANVAPAAQDPANGANANDAGAPASGSGHRSTHAASGSTGSNTGGSHGSGSGHHRGGGGFAIE